MMMEEPEPSVRVDRWLLAARAFKTRTLCQQACSGGKVTVNHNKASPHRPVRIGDRVRIEGPRGLRDFVVQGLAEKRLPGPEARALYEDKSPPPPKPTEAIAPLRTDPGSGRPSKRDRRRLERVRRR